MFYATQPEMLKEMVEELIQFGDMADEGDEVCASAGISTPNHPGCIWVWAGDQDEADQLRDRIVQLLNMHGEEDHDHVGT